jgi:signal transduction histidine kinase
MSVLAKLAVSRRLLLASLVFALFVLFDIALFGWLIFRSLSQREVERVLLETRNEAQDLARQLARQAERQGKDLFTAVAVERETQTYIDSMLRQRDFVRDVEIRDKNGVLVYQSRSKATLPVTPKVALPEHSVELPAQHIERKTSEQALTLQIPDIQVPIGELGTLQIGLSAGELSKRIGVLRGDLIRQASWIGALSIVLLLSAYAAVWLALRRARRLELQAAEAERMAYIGTLASGLAHEIRNPLNSLNLNMQMLEEEIAERGSAGLPSGQRLLSITRSEINRLERLATDFLAYAKPRPLELEEVPAVRPLERLREVLAGEIQTRQARVMVEDRSGGARIKIDPNQINQLLLNLAHNAFAAIEEAGRPPVLRLTAYRHGTSVALELVDNGIGISPADEARIFELFYSTRKGGTGLGLAIVERIARAHGGEVRVKSAPGVGTAVTLALPAAAAAEPVLRAALKPSASV